MKIQNQKIEKEVEKLVYDINLNISNKVRKARKEKGWTQAELGKKLGVNKAYISDIENMRHSFTIKTIFTLKKVLGFDLTDIFE